MCRYSWLNQVGKADPGGRRTTCESLWHARMEIHSAVVFAGAEVHRSYCRRTPYRHAIGMGGTAVRIE